MDTKKPMTVDDEIAYNNYKLTADKILQLLSQIREDPSASAKRWVWELLQNAKDVPNRFGKVSVEIELVSQDILKFRHNGDCFSTKNITGLVQQVSSKDSQNLEGQTGKFGTGFICTHLLSDIIDVEGIVRYMGIDRRFKIVLDRSGYRSEDLLPRIETTLEELRHIETAYEVVDNYEQNRTEQSFDTVFTYHLTTQEKQEAAVAGLEDLINTLPITLVTQSKKIKQVHVINRIKGTDVVYKCDSSSLGDNVQMSVVKIDNIIKKYLSYITDDVALTTEFNDDNNILEIVKRDSKHPVLYRDFPLIGSERFFFPYTLNGFDFNPTERRNGLLLNSADHPSCVSNRNIIEKAVEAALKFNEWLITHNATNRYLFASSRIPESSEKYSENVAAPWIKNLQVNWRKQLLQERLVETENGTDLLVNLSVPSFTPTSTKDINETFYNLLHGQYIGRGVLPIFKHLHGWLDVVRPEYETWGTKLKYEKDDLLNDLSALLNVDTLAIKISKTRKDTIEWLNKVYKFLIDQNMLNEFDNYAIIPNQRGEFKLLKDLYSDHTSRIPEILKNIYNSVNQDNATVQHILMDAEVDASVFGNILRSFSLKEMIEKLNEYVKTGTSIYKNGSSIEVRSKVAYSILALYPNITEASVLNYRKAIYDFCSAYRVMGTYSLVDTAEIDLWKEADNYWFNQSYEGIASKNTIINVTNQFFISEKTQDKTLSWLDNYLQFYRNHSHGDLIKEQAVFPNQQLNLKKLSDLRYDNDIPEEFKDLANVAYNPDRPLDVYRHQLIHHAIKGYEQQNPLTIKEIYEYVKKRFDESNDTTKEAIARHTITILVKPELGEPDEKKLYDFAKTISGHTFEVVKYVENHSGFNWGFAQEFYVKFLASQIANSVNLDGFKTLSVSFTDINNQQLTQWIDSFIEFLHAYKNKKYWSVVTDKDSGIGIWLNQNNDFCKFQNVREDKVLVPELFDLTYRNRHINKNFREELFTLQSSKTSYLETAAIELPEVATFIDKIIKDYDGNKQDENFRSLVFSIGKLCSKVKGLEDLMDYYKEYKNSLIVWSLGEGTTMDLVGSIVQHGDEKLKIVKDILDRGTSIEELKDIKEVLQGCPADKFDKVKDLVNKLASEDTYIKDNDEIPLNDNDETDVVVVPKTYELEVEDFEGHLQTVRIDQVQYAGLSLDEIERYVGEAKDAVVKYFRELNEKQNLGLQFDVERIAKHSYSQLYGIRDRNGKDIPIVVHSYKGPQYRYFDLNWYDWQLLSQKGAMLFVLTVTGLQCIPLYALPIRNFNISISNEMSNENRAALLTLAAVGKQYSTLSFDFGNNMPHGFKDPLPFDYVPEQLNKCILSIKEVCDQNIPQIANMYNSGKNIPLIRSSVGYSLAMEAVNKGHAREIFDAPANDTQAPSVGTSFID